MGTGCVGQCPTGDRDEYLISSGVNVRYNGPMDKETIIRQTRAWLQSVVIGMNFCPFARKVFDQDAIHYNVQLKTQFGDAVEELYQECVYLDDHPEIETSLIIFAEDFTDFDDYLDLLVFANHMLERYGYEGIYQLASFHPDYEFDSSESDDAANYTNRSPYPMLHLIREASLENALQHYPDPEGIPERNIAEARKQGLEKMQAMLESCKHTKE